MARRAKRRTKREAAVDAREEAVSSLAHRLASCFVTRNWPRAVGLVEEAAKLIHGALPTASPYAVARMAFVVVQVRALSGKPSPTPAAIIVMLHLVAAGKMAPHMLDRLPCALRTDVQLFSPPLEETWLEKLHASLEKADAQGTNAVEEGLLQ